MSPPKIFIAVPAFGMNMNAQTATSLVALTKVLTERGWFGGFTAQSQPDIVDLRNAMATLFFDCIDATHLLMCDADMQWEPELILDMVAADKELVGVPYPKKRFPISWVGSALSPPPEPEGNLLELEGIGCGVMLLRRDCIEQIISAGNVEIDKDPQGVLGDLIKPLGATRALHLFDRVVEEGNRRLSEDYSLCWRYRQSGGKIWAVINHTITHLGICQFTARYSDLYSKESN